jgi:hypothetical protein
MNDAQKCNVPEKAFLKRSTSFVGFFKEQRNRRFRWLIRPHCTSGPFGRIDTTNPDIFTLVSTPAGQPHYVSDFLPLSPSDDQRQLAGKSQLLSLCDVRFDFAKMGRTELPIGKEDLDNALVGAHQALNADGKSRGSMSD